MNKSNGGRRCAAMKNVKTANGTVRRCTRFVSGESMDVEHRGYGFADLGNLLNWNTSGSDLAIGVGAGLVGAGALKWAFANVPALAQHVPAPVQKAAPALGGAVAAGVLYGVFKNRGQALGAVAAGATLQGWDLLKSQFTALADPYYVNMGALINEPAQLAAYGALIDDPRPGMADLAASDLGGDDDAP